MAPQNADSESMQVQELPVVQLQKPENEIESKEETISEGSIDRIPVRLWVMHGAVMFGREFCYAMETALVTPVLLQIEGTQEGPSLTMLLWTSKAGVRKELELSLRSITCHCRFVHEHVKN
ncbi:UNVERIFIED_CONTAM: hypothetical protein K2H54_010374 [Gekko kuhli]